MIAAAFGIVALLLVGPVPALYARASWTLHSPRAAITLWQAIALAAVLSAFSCGLAIASNLLIIAPNGALTANPLTEARVIGWPLWILSVVVFALTLLVGARLLFTTIRIAHRTRARRAHHRTILDLLDHAERPSRSTETAEALRARDVRMLGVDQPMAYCLPGLRRRVVLSEGTVNRLSRNELEAVISHERAHLRARHDLVLEAFIALYAAFPRFVRSKSALGAVQLLVELLADDHAVRTHGRAPLARAIVTCADAVTPKGALAIGGPSTLLRVQRLGPDAASPRRARLTSLAAYCAAVGILVVPTMAVAIPWINELSRLASAA